MAIFTIFDFQSYSVIYMFSMFIDYFICFLCLIGSAFSIQCSLIIFVFCASLFQCLIDSVFTVLVQCFIVSVFTLLIQCLSVSDFFYSEFPSVACVLMSSN